MVTQWNTSYLFGGNADFIEDLYDQYLIDPRSIDPKYKAYFDSLQDASNSDVPQNEIKEKFVRLTEKPRAVSGGTEIDAAQIKVWQLIAAYRSLGVVCADLDPLKRSPLIKPKELELGTYGLEAALDVEFATDMDQPNSGSKLKLKDIVDKFDSIYCKKVGFEFEHMVVASERVWLRNYVETQYVKYQLSTAERTLLLQNLVEADGWERYLGTKYPGAKRFSLEGGDSLIPALDRLIRQSAKVGINDIHIGMAHRGRLNVLVNIAGKSPAKLFAEFDGNYKFADFVLSGDVKYHKGYKCNYVTDDGPIKITLAYNPSHLEVINPVLNGMVRARQDAAASNKAAILGVLIHGDSALIGLGTNQGVLNMAQTRAYNVEGMLHIVVNNQVGFTTSDTRDTRSSRYCTDIAKMIDAPIVHVNADDVDSVAFVMDLAVAYRTKFKKDIMLDLVCFRRHGHQETDDPTLTQPYMYSLIKQHPGTRKLFADKLIAANVVTDAQVNAMVEEYRLSLNKGEHPHKADLIALPWYAENDINLAQTKAAKFNDKIATAIDQKMIKSITQIITELPSADFQLHPTVAKVVEARKLMGAGTKPLDFGMAEMLAYGSLLKAGINIRLTGEDSGRGTFSHRHAVWHDVRCQDVNESGYIPLTKCESPSRHPGVGRDPSKSKFRIYDSVLNEECVLGFEYGYSTERLHDLVIWEAQFGDFANGGQVMIDQFIASAEAKWGTLSPLTLLLPHGYDGQGPEHSSARIERFLQLCAQNNLQLAVPSTAAQMFHLLRRQALSAYLKPLAIFMSKRLLRYVDAMSDLNEVIQGSFQLVIADNLAKASTVNKVLVCTGQVYYDLVKARAGAKLEAKIAIIRVEQLYPFPAEELHAELSKYAKCELFVWVQEEPKNQGAWVQLRENLDNTLAKSFAKAKSQPHFNVISRPEAAAPACGLTSMHNEELANIIAAAISLPV